MWCQPGNSARQEVLRMATKKRAATTSRKRQRTPSPAASPRRRPAAVAEIPASDPQKKPFVPEILDRTVIAIPLLKELKAEEEAIAAGSKEPRKIYDVIIDLRERSPTFGQWYGLELAPDNGLMLYAPEGFAHGYQTLQDDTEMYYLTSAPYVPAAARGVRYDDPAFGVSWPLPASIVSVADRQWPDFRH